MIDQTLIEVIDKAGIAAISLVTVTYFYRLFSNHLAENTKALNKLEALLNRIEGKLSSG